MAASGALASAYSDRLWVKADIPPDGLVVKHEAQECEKAQADRSAWASREPPRRGGVVGVYSAWSGFLRCSS